MHIHDDRPSRVGVAIVGLGGAVATTVVAGIELLRQGNATTQGLPLAELDPTFTAELPPYESLIFGGWDLYADNLANAARIHNVLTPAQLEQAGPALEQISPWPAAGNPNFCRNVEGEHQIEMVSHRATVEQICTDLRHFRQEQRLEGVVMVNLASTERRTDVSLPVFASLDAFERALDANSPEIGPAMLYAYAAIAEDTPYVNFTPSVAVDIPALMEFAERRGVPVAGKDGKTGQTMLKTVIASALRSRALHVDGWFSTNILGNRDGQALADAESLQSKLTTKSTVIDQILGYRVEDHVVYIHYYRPRGDNKEAWDNIDISGFLGQPMQLKVNFLCRDSVLAAPLVIELARLMELAQRRGMVGIQEQLGYFFKLPMTAAPEIVPEHALHVQEQRMLAWLANDVANPLERSVG
ncbi:MAG: inositol-3-phosphate synthase [Chloroflexaceae bacterium]|nr:inositol-3-phosphate synthase [Chloroflexaceae bacterium]